MEWQTGLVIILNQPKQCTCLKIPEKRAEAPAEVPWNHSVFVPKSSQDHFFLLFFWGSKVISLHKVVNIDFGRLEMKRV